MILWSNTSFYLNLVLLTFVFYKLVTTCRNTFLKTIGLYNPEKRNYNHTIKDLITKDFFTGAESMRQNESEASKALMESELVQEELCKYMLHTGGSRLG